MNIMNEKYRLLLIKKITQDMILKRIEAFIRYLETPKILKYKAKQDNFKTRQI